MTLAELNAARTNLWFSIVSHLEGAVNASGQRIRYPLPELVPYENEALTLNTNVMPYLVYAATWGMDLPALPGQPAPTSRELECAYALRGIGYYAHEQYDIHGMIRMMFGLYVADHPALDIGTWPPPFAYRQRVTGWPSWLTNAFPLGLPDNSRWPPPDPRDDPVARMSRGGGGEPIAVWDTREWVAWHAAWIAEGAFIDRHGVPVRDGIRRDGTRGPLDPCGNGRYSVASGHDVARLMRGVPAM